MEQGYKNTSVSQIVDIAGSKLPSVYAYAVDTAIQLTLTELNENLREIYIEAYTAPDTAEYIYVQTTAELKEIFGGNFPDYSDSDFYEMDIGTAGLMRKLFAMLEMKYDFKLSMDGETEETR